MKHKKILLILSFVLIFILSFGACGSNTNSIVQEYVDETQKTFDEYKVYFADIYSDISITAKGNVITYKYTYKDQQDIEQVKKDREAESEVLQSQNLQVIQNFMDAGVKKPFIKFEYYNPDGSLIYALEIT